MTRVVILAPQPEEVGPLLALLRARRESTCRAATFWRAERDGVELTVAIGGVGRRRAHSATRALLERGGASRLLVVGVAGALTPDLRLGDVVVAEAVESERRERLYPDPSVLGELRRAGARGATVVTVDRMISTVVDREAVLRGVARSRSRRLAAPVAPMSAGLDAAAEATPLDLPKVAPHAPPAPAGEPLLPVVVDMESYDAVAVALAHGVPSTILRAVSDTSADELPAFLESCRGVDGDIDRYRVVLRALLSPRSIPALLELRRRVALGARALADVVARALPALTADDP